MSILLSLESPAMSVAKFTSRITKRTSHLSPDMHLQCTVCGKTYAMDAVKYVCPAHGDYAAPSSQGVLDVVYDFDEINRQTSPNRISQSREFSMWRYWDLLPLEDYRVIPTLQVGWTPLVGPDDDDTAAPVAAPAPAAARAG